MTSEVGTGNLRNKSTVRRDKLRVETSRRFKIDQVIDRMPNCAGIFERWLDQFVDREKTTEIVRQ